MTGLECVQSNVDAICRFHCNDPYLFACCLSLSSITTCRQPMLVAELPRKACQKAGLEAFALQSNIFGRCLAESSRCCHGVALAKGFSGLCPFLTGS